MALCAAAVVLCAYLASFAPLQAKRAGFLGTAQTVSVRVRGRRPRLHYRLLTLCPAPTDPVPRGLLLARVATACGRLSVGDLRKP